MSKLVVTVPVLPSEPVLAFPRVQDHEVVNYLVDTLKEEVDEDFVRTFAASLNQDDNAWLDFDLVWKEVGYSRKDVAKDALLNGQFERDIDYKIMSLEEAQIAFREIPECLPKVPTKARKGGIPKQYIYLTVEAAKAFAMQAGTEQGKKFRKYMLTVEKALKVFIRTQIAKEREVLENTLIKFDDDKKLLLLDVDKAKELMEEEKKAKEKAVEAQKEAIKAQQQALKEKEALEKKYKLSRTAGFLYIRKYKTRDNNVWKFGKTIDPEAREKSYNTGHEKSEYEFICKTEDCVAAEALAKCALRPFKYLPNTSEVVHVDLEFIKDILKTCADNVDHLVDISTDMFNGTYIKYKKHITRIRDRVEEVKAKNPHHLLKFLVDSLDGNIDDLIIEPETTGYSIQSFQRIYKEWFKNTYDSDASTPAKLKAYLITNFTVKKVKSDKRFLNGVEFSASELILKMMNTLNITPEY